MDFGKLENIENVDFRLPDIPSSTSKCLSTSDAKELSIFIGGTGWSMKDWVGSYYPKGTTAKDYLKAYSAQFNTIEMNTTHYRIPTYELIERWRTTSSKAFRFCPKLAQSISHKGDLGIVSGQLDAFVNSIAGLGPKLGPCFMQLPPYFGPDKLSLLSNFVRAWPAELRLAIEFRHPDWFTPANNRALFELFEGKSIIKLITDVAGRRDVLHMDIWQSYCLLRFVGNDFHPSDYTRLDDWLIRIIELKELGLKELHFFMHQPDNLKAPAAIQYLLRALKRTEGIQFQPMLPNFNNQLPLF